MAEPEIAASSDKHQVLSERIASRTKGRMAENEEEWFLCLDIESGSFFIRHTYDGVKRSNLTSVSWDERLEVDGYSGRGADKIECAKSRLLARLNG